MNRLAVPPSGAASTNSYSYTGREADAKGLYYYRARYYHPGLQRFISQDPISFASGDTNFYAYIFNSPTNFSDPLGLGSFKDAWESILAAIGHLNATAASVPGVVILLVSSDSKK